MTWICPTGLHTVSISYAAILEYFMKLLCCLLVQVFLRLFTVPVISRPVIMANWILILVATGALFQSAFAVDRGNFKTCDQNAFCRYVFMFEILINCTVTFY